MYENLAVAVSSFGTVVVSPILSRASLLILREGPETSKIIFKTRILRIFKDYIWKMKRRVFYFNHHVKRYKKKYFLDF